MAEINIPRLRIDSLKDKKEEIKDAEQLPEGEGYLVIIDDKYHLFAVKKDNVIFRVSRLPPKLSGFYLSSGEFIFEFIVKNKKGKYERLWISLPTETVLLLCRILAKAVTDCTREMDKVYLKFFEKAVRKEKEEEKEERSETDAIYV